MTAQADSGLVARRAALRLFAAALARRGGLETALAEPAFRRLADQDRGFARALVMATLRRLEPITARLLAGRLQHEPPAAVRDLLRLGLAQAFWLATPDFAAVDTSVRLAPVRFRGLVNAVLRGALRAGPPADDPEVLAPAWLFARWRANFGPEAARAIAGEIAREPATDLTLKGPADDELAAALAAEPLAGGGLRTARGGDVALWPGFAEGQWWVQDAAAAIPARLLAVRAGETVLDLCAAPCGKSLQLPAAGASLVALDRSAERLRRLEESLARTGLTAEIVAADALAWRDSRRFAAVLLDAPCTATGTFRRHPDVLVNVRPGDIASLAVLQAGLLPAAGDRVERRRAAGLQRLLPRTGGGRGAGPRLPRRAARFRP